MSNYLVTGAAGFIGSRTTQMLIEQGHTVIGVDNINDAYDPRMKDYRLKKLQELKGFTFHKHDISDKSVIDLFKNEKALALVEGITQVGYLTHEVPIFSKWWKVNVLHLEDFLRTKKIFEAEIE